MLMLLHTRQPYPVQYDPNKDHKLNLRKCQNDNLCRTEFCQSWCWCPLHVSICNGKLYSQIITMFYIVFVCSHILECCICTIWTMRDFYYYVRNVRRLLSEESLLLSHCSSFCRLYTTLYGCETFFIKNKILKESWYLYHQFISDISQVRYISTTYPFPAHQIQRNGLLLDLNRAW